MKKKTTPARKKKKYKTAPVLSPELLTAADFNAMVKTASEALCVKLLAEEKAGRRRKWFITRLAARITFLHRETEMERLMS